MKPDTDSSSQARCGRSGHRTRGGYEVSVTREREADRAVAVRCEERVTVDSPKSSSKQDKVFMLGKEVSKEL